MTTKIGFIVEGNTDRQIVEAMARQVLGERFLISTVRLGGLAALPWAYTTVFKFIEKGYSKIILVLDANSVDPEEIAEKKHRVEQSFREHALEERIEVCFATPVIESWLLAKFQENPEDESDPKTALQRREVTLDFRGLIEQLDLVEARRRSPSLDEFLKVLEVIKSQELKAA